MSKEYRFSVTGFVSSLEYEHKKANFNIHCMEKNWGVNYAPDTAEPFGVMIADGTSRRAARHKLLRKIRETKKQNINGLRYLRFEVTNLK